MIHRRVVDVCHVDGLGRGDAGGIPRAAAVVDREAYGARGAAGLVRSAEESEGLDQLIDDRRGRKVSEPIDDNVAANDGQRANRVAAVEDIESARAVVGKGESSTITDHN